MRYFLLSILFISWIYNLSLHKDRFKNPKIGFYFWTTKCKIPKNFSFKAYIKILDIGYDSKLRIIKTKCNYKKDFTPVIYIDNKVLKRYSYKKLLNIITKYTKNYKKLQFDCDWTLQTKDKYFKLLQGFKDKYLTTTIRLHQIKYFKKSGIPPVQRGILMFYNMSDFLDIHTKNYILDLNKAKPYFKDFKYPLPLDIALPIYSQATIIRLGKVVGLIEGVTKDELKRDFIKIKNNFFKSTKNHYFHSRIIYKNDLIRLDMVYIKDLKKSIRFLKSKLKQPINNIIFFRYSNKYKDIFDKIKIIN